MSSGWEFPDYPGFEMGKRRVMDERYEGAGEDVAAKSCNPLRRTGENEYELHARLAKEKAQYAQPRLAQQRLSGGSIAGFGQLQSRPLDPSLAHNTMAQVANIERDLPPTAIELRCLSEALEMQAQLLGELQARLQVVSLSRCVPTQASGEERPARSSMTEAIHGLRCRAMDHNESLRNMIAGLEI